MRLTKNVSSSRPKTCRDPQEQPYADAADNIDDDGAISSQPAAVNNQQPASSSQQSAVSQQQSAVSSQ
jgi:hypothetical protein